MVSVCSLHYLHQSPPPPDNRAWQARLEVPHAAVPAVEAFFETLAPEDAPPAISSFALGIGDRWRVDAIFAEPVDIDAANAQSLWSDR